MPRFKLGDIVQIYKTNLLYIIIKTIDYSNMNNSYRYEVNLSGLYIYMYEATYDTIVSTIFRIDNE